MQGTRITVTEAAAVLHLASSSPRRREILDTLGIVYSQGSPDVDEQALPDEAPGAMVLRLAAAKAAAGRKGVNLPVLAADTAVVLGSRMYGKPSDREDALEMLAQLSGRRHEVMTGVALHWDDGEASSLSVSQVTFREIGPDEALAYWQSGEPCDKAGAYAVQGLGGVFVESLQGSFSGVIGLPVFETAQLLAKAGIDIIGVKEVHG